MNDKLLKSGSAQEGLQEGQKPLDKGSEQSMEVKEASLSVSEGVGEIADESGQFSEDEKRDKGTYIQNGASAQAKTSLSSSVKQLPPVETMIQQTVEAIQDELQKTEDEIKALKKDSQAKPYLLNDKVARVRLLNGFLTELKRAARLAEEFVVNLWKQFVKKS